MPLLPIDSPSLDQPVVKADKSSPVARVRRIVLGVCVGLLCLGLGIWALIQLVAEHETRYQGKTVFQWIVQIQSSDLAASNAAYAVFSKEIVPDLMHTLLQDTNDSRIRLWLVENLNTLPRVNILFEPADARRWGAANGIGYAGPAGLQAGPKLLELLRGNDNFLRGAAANALGKLGALPQEVIPLLIQCLDNEELRETAALSLAGYGPQARGAVPKLLTLMRINDKDLHHAVVMALTSIDPTQLRPTKNP